MAVKENVQEETSQAPRVVAADRAADALLQEIAVRAYHRFCARGCAPGSDVDDWLAAERELLAGQQTPAAPSARGPRDRGGRQQGRSRH